MANDNFISISKRISLLVTGCEWNCTFHYSPLTKVSTGGLARRLLQLEALLKHPIYYLTKQEFLKPFFVEYILLLLRFMKL